MQICTFSKGCQVLEQLGEGGGGGAMDGQELEEVGLRNAGTRAANLRENSVLKGQRSFT